MSKRRWAVRRSTASSCGVSRSKSRVPMPASRMTCATYWLRGLWRLLPLPCANRTTPGEAGGTINSPSTIAGPDGMRTARASAPVSVIRLFMGASLELSHAAREGLRRLALWPRHQMQWVQRLGLVEVQEGIVAPGQHRGHVVAECLVLRVVDHADSPVPSG